MTGRRSRKFDILSVGELLIDFISLDFAENLEEATNFKRLQGGSPANLCMNMARLGNQTKLVASIGNDDMGRFLFQFVRELGVDCEHLKRVEEPTTLILVTRSKNVSNFEAYRSADCLITIDQFPEHLLEEISIFHTTCFALSQNPAQAAILETAEKVVGHGAQLSIDANYAQKIWPNQAQAQEVVAKYCSLGTLVKISEVDWERLYNTPLREPKKAAEHFLKLGAEQVCVTLGSEGCLVADIQGQHFLPSRKVEVRDTTGAGDAFWSGYLTAWLDGHHSLDCAKAGRKMAELKLEQFGPLPKQVDRKSIYVDLEESLYG